MIKKLKKKCQKKVRNEVKIKIYFYLKTNFNLLNNITKIILKEIKSLILKIMTMA